MNSRLELSAILNSIPGVKKAYFQPSRNTQMEYPCIIYEVDNANTKFADDKPYNYKEGYVLKVVDYDPDTPIRFEVAKLPTARFSRHYVADRLHHYVYHIYNF